MGTCSVTNAMIAADTGDLGGVGRGVTPPTLEVEPRAGFLQR